MTTAREEIFGSIRQNLAASRPFDAVRGEHFHAVSPVSAVAAERVDDIETLIQNFCDNAGSLGVHVEVVCAADAREQMNAIIDRIGAKKIAVSNVAIVSEAVSAIDSLEFTVNASTEFLFDSDLGITSAQWAIAETGTLVLEAESEDHRLISLVPPVHLCMIEASRIRQTMGEILELTRDGLGHANTFVTGASRTSDIELTLAIGVHGPAELHVIIVRDR